MLVTLSEEDSLQVLWSNKPKIQAFGDEMKFLSRLEERKKLTAREKRMSEIVIFVKSPYDQKVIVLLHVDH